MNYFFIAYRQLVELLTPPLMRSPVLIVVLQSMISPISWLYNRFMQYRNANLYHLSITGQVFSLERMLNDRYDNTQRRIYIKNGVFFDQIYIYRDDEDEDIYLFTPGEATDLYLYTDVEVVDGADFIVNVPGSLSFLEAEIYTLINIYKQPGNRGLINWI